MKCPTCEAVNDPDAKTCSACGKPMKPRRRRRGEEDNTPLSPEAEAFVRRASRLFRLGLWSLVPLLGLLLGPLTVIGALWMRGPDQPGRAMVRIAFWIGLLTAVSQWAGVWLIFLSYASGQ